AVSDAPAGAQDQGTPAPATSPQASTSATGLTIFYFAMAGLMTECDRYAYRSGEQSEELKEKIKKSFMGSSYVFSQDDCPKVNQQGDGIIAGCRVQSQTTEEHVEWRYGTGLSP